MRCLTLAYELKKHGATIRFISRNLPDHLREMLKVKGMELVSFASKSSSSQIDDLAHSAWLETSQSDDAQHTIKALSDQAWDWLVVDHYAIDTRWESAMRGTAKKIMVIDDLADRQHNCDLLLDQNFYHDQGLRYEGLIPEQCLTLLGPSYVLLRSEFVEVKQQLKGRDGTIARILIFFGGNDTSNETEKVLQALQQFNKTQIFTDAVVGHSNPHRGIIQELCEKLPNVTYHCNVSNMAKLIQNADLGIGAGGSAMWERCYLGLPTITVVTAANQINTTEDVADIGAIEYLGRSNGLATFDYARAINKMLTNAQHVKQISDLALSVLPKIGTTTVVDEMYGLM